MDADVKSRTRVASARVSPHEMALIAAAAGVSGAAHRSDWIRHVVLGRALEVLRGVTALVAEPDGE